METEVCVMACRDPKSRHENHAGNTRWGHGVHKREALLSRLGGVEHQKQTWRRAEWKDPHTDGVMAAASTGTLAACLTLGANVARPRAMAFASRAEGDQGKKKRIGLTPDIADTTRINSDHSVLRVWQHT